MSRESWRDGRLVARWDDDARTVTAWDESGAVVETRPYTAEENVAADQAATDAAQSAALLDLESRVARIEAHLWPAEPDPEPDATVPTLADRGGVWPAGTLITDDGRIWRNISGVPLTVAPSGMPGQPSPWTHLYVEVTTSAEPEPTAAEWSATATYAVGDLATKGGITYRCLIAHGPERQGTWAPPATGVWGVA